MTVPTGDISPTTAPASTADVTSSVQPSTIPIDITTAAAIGAALVTDTDPHAVFRRFGVIAGTNDNGTVNVVIDGVTVPNLSRVSSYTPTIGDTVMLDVVGTDTYVIGIFAPSRRAYVRPTGTIESWIGTTAPDYALLCSGQAVSRVTYADLWQWAQTASKVGGGLFGSGDGKTTFTVPNMSGRSLIGAGVVDNDTHSLGETGGIANSDGGAILVPGGTTYGVRIWQDDGSSDDAALSDGATPTYTSRSPYLVVNMIIWT